MQNPIKAAADVVSKKLEETSPSSLGKLAVSLMMLCGAGIVVYATRTKWDDIAEVFQNDRDTASNNDDNQAAEPIEVEAEVIDVE